MPALFLFIVMSLTAAAHPVKDKSLPTKIAVKPAAAPETKPIANEKAVESKVVAIPVALSDAATPPPAIAIIEAESRGLLMPSETDAPLSVKYWPSDKIALLPDDVAALAEHQVGAPVEIKTVAAFFKNAATVEDWMSDDEKASAQRFQKLIVTLETQLEKPQVYLFGERARTVVIIGKVKGGFGGVVTLVVET